MATASRVRQAGQRHLPPSKPRAGSSLVSNSMGVPTGQFGEHRLNTQQIWALEQMFEGNPAVKAARTVLSGQLLSGGISLRKDGEDVELTQAFKNHLNEVWIPFAQDVIDCFLKWGMVAISYEDYDDEVRQAALLAKRRKVEEPTGKGKSRAAKAVETAPKEPPVVMPMVPALGTYDIAFRMGGRSGYKREYYVYSTSPSTGVEPDEDVRRVVVKQHPDIAGNVNSPLASVFELGSFVAAITELAMMAEASRSRPRMVTQMRKKDASALDPGNLFFDSESRAVQTSANADESAGQARALQIQQQMCDLINKLQTRQFQPDHQGGIYSGAKPTGKSSYAPPDVSPSLFHLPKDHEIAPGQSNPESRGDLEALTRLSIEQFSAAFGVPSDLVFSGRFAGKSTSQMSLLNTTVSQLAKAVDSVLTIAYRDIYASNASEDVGQLQLLTSPLAATDEVLALYTGGLVPIEIAMPSVLHAIGASKDAIDAAVEKANKRDEEKKKLEEDQNDFAQKDNTISLEIRQVELQQHKKDLTNSVPASSSLSSKPSGSGLSSANHK